jgi:enamine deaminase RidA (YjgF/YER057c/UK114 family)
MTRSIHPDPPHRRIDPPSLAPAKGYSNGVLAAAGRTLYLAGQVGWDREGKFPPGGDLVAQVDRALGNLVEVLKAAGAVPEHVVSMRIYVRSADRWAADSKAIGEAWRKHMGRWFPAMTLVEVSRLYEKEALVEIESVAVIPATA